MHGRGHGALAMGGRSRVGWVLAVPMAGVVGVVAPGGAVGKKGQVTEFSAGITPSAQPEAITAGPDGNLWFTESTFENGDGRIGRLGPGPSPKPRGPDGRAQSRGGSVVRYGSAVVVVGSLSAPSRGDVNWTTAAGMLLVSVPNGHHCARGPLRMSTTTRAQ